MEFRSRRPGWPRSGFDVITIDASGNGVYGPAENGQFYPAEALTGTEVINGRRVDCFSPEWLVEFHTGYEVDATDWADVSALCQRFGIPIPATSSNSSSSPATARKGRP
jgi:lincosamide nucleotidyltransferase A/C/D/E